MPLVPFESLPDHSRLWVFGARAPLDEVDTPRLLKAVDGFLKSWKAHGEALTCGREFRDDFFLAVGVDERASNASGCSIDGLFRVLQQIEQGIGTSLVGGGNIWFRDSVGMVHSVSREEFSRLAAHGDIADSTHVFDTSITTVGEYRKSFEKSAAESWHRSLLGV